MKLGFTLIELLIVIVLLGIAIALVGPLTIKQVENARARNERQMLERWLHKQSFNAFAKQQQYSFKFDGKAIYAIPQQPTEPEVVTVFNYLFFSPQHIVINQNGYIQPDQLTFSINQREQHINLASLLTDKYEH
ncbi:type II secretion system protein [Rheinheimera metallidurans]|uniref:type II secretion system protein n=1 Tax=Rheinheimera metallidurans TaxID=2925781 RepID=UPI00300133F7